MDNALESHLAWGEMRLMPNNITKKISLPMEVGPVIVALPLSVAEIVELLTPPRLWKMPVGTYQEFALY